MLSSLVALCCVEPCNTEPSDRRICLEQTGGSIAVANGQVLKVFRSAAVALDIETKVRHQAISGTKVQKNAVLRRYAVWVWQYILTKHWTLPGEPLSIGIGRGPHEIPMRKRARWHA
jgi:hypothetical protein